MIREIYEEIKRRRKLPSPSGVALEFLRLTKDDRCTLEELTRVIESDPATASRILKAINSPISGLPRRVTSISRAAAMLGRKTLCHQVLGFSLIAANLQGHCELFDYERFWSDSLARAAASRYLADQVDQLATDEAFTCGLLCQIGRLALATAFPEAYAQMLRMAESEDNEELVEIEASVFKIDHNALAAEMMEDWGLPEPLRYAVRHQDIPVAGTKESGVGVLAQVLRLAGQISHLLTAPVLQGDALTRAVAQAARMGIGNEVFSELFEKTSSEWSEMGKIFSLPAGKKRTLGEIHSKAYEQRARLEREEKGVPG